MRYARLMIAVLALAVVGGVVFWFVTRSETLQDLQSVTLSTQDGVQLAALYYAGSEDRGIVLAHGYGETRKTTEAFALQLQEQGYSVVALDLRGHGESARGAATSSAGEWQNLPMDIEAGRQLLLSQSSSMTVYAIGGDIGANAVIQHAVDYDGITAVVTLSPQPNNRGLDVTAAFQRYSGPLFVVDASVDPDDDRFHGQGIEPIVVEPAGDLYFLSPSTEKEYLAVNDGGHGWALVNNNTDVAQRIIDFLGAQP